MTDRPPCRCYVSYLPEHVRFMLRYGAHDETCAVYRQSLDPVDRLADESIRAQYRIDAPQIVKLVAELMS